MATTIARPPAAAVEELLAGGHGVFLTRLTWQGYQELLQRLEGRRLRFTYDRGRFEAMPTCSLGDEVLATTVSRPPVTAVEELLAGGHGVLLTRLNWQGYQELLQHLSPRRLRFAYDRGRFETMPTSLLHELLKWLLGRLVEVWLDEKRLPFRPGGEVTFNREDLYRGLAPDECYWITNASLITGGTVLDLTHDPPPDLAFEIELSRTVLSRLAIHAALGVPEVWRYDGQLLSIGRLGPDQEYVWEDHSTIFPDLPIDVFARFLQEGQTAAVPMDTIRGFRVWVRDYLARQATGDSSE